MNKVSAIVTGLAMLLASQIPISADEPKATTSKATGSASDDLLGDLYEHLASSIIEIRAAEDNLVRGMLIHYHVAAQRHLSEAAGEEKDRVKHLEAAAAQVSYIANEGDKRAQAVRQRLSNAGHYHQKDAETKEDFMFINSAEKKNLLDLAKRIGQLGKGESGDIKKASEDLKSLFAKSIGRE
jgi:hypothetical protein